MTSMRGGVVVVMLLVAVGSAAAFDASKYDGTWTGTWKNKTFKVDGTLSATVTASPDGETLTIDHTISSLFNCGPTSATRVLRRGVDFTDDGLSFTTENAAWGGVTFASKSKKKVEKIGADGGTPCNQGISAWKLRARLKQDRLKGTMKIVFAEGKPKRAKAVFKAQKQ